MCIVTLAIDPAKREEKSIELQYLITRVKKSAVHTVKDITVTLESNPNTSHPHQNVQGSRAE